MANSTSQRPVQPIRDYGIVLVGMTGSGKSATGNTILGRQAFKSEPSGAPVTGVSSYAKYVGSDRTITVVDTPGVCNHVRPTINVKREIARIAFLLREGVHCFVICMDGSEVRVSEAKKQFLDQLKVTFHADVFDYCILVYTKPETELHYISLDKFVKEQKKNNDMKSFLERIGDKILVVNNRASDPEKKRSKDDIIAMVDKVIVDNIVSNRTAACTNATFNTANKLRKKVVSVVEENNCHPSLVNAVIEAVIWFSNWGTIAEKEFVKKVISILCSSDHCHKNHENLVFTNDSKITTFSVAVCEEHIRLIYRAIKLNIGGFYKAVATISNHKMKCISLGATVTALAGLAIGMSSAVVVGAILGVPAVIAYHIGDRVY